MQDELAELERRGHEAREAAQARDTAAARTTLNRKAALQIAAPYAFAQVMLLIVIGLVMAAAVLGWQDPPLGDRLILPCGIALGVALLAVFVTWLMAPAAVARERAWVDKLPFKLDGYFEAMEQPMSRKNASGPSFATHTSWGRLRIHFQQPPPPDYLKDIVAGLGRGDFLRGSSDDIQIGGVSSPRILHSYVHELADRVLVPLHGKHGIDRVVVTLDPP